MKSFKTIVENILYEAKINTISGDLKEYAKDNNINIEEIKCFRPDGKKYMPNGVYLYNGIVHSEITENTNSFINLEEDIAEYQGTLPKYQGGVITFAISVNTIIDQEDCNKLIKYLKKFYYSLKNYFLKNTYIDSISKRLNAEFSKAADNKIDGMSVGHFFKGKYISGDKVYNDKSLAVEINGISSELLLLFATEICKVFKQEAVLVKDFNSNKIFLVDSRSINGNTPEDILLNAKESLKNL